MKYIDDFITDVKLIAHVVNQQVIHTNYLFVSIFFFVIILFILQWLFNIDQLEEIFTNSALTFSDRLDIFIEAFFSLFRYVNDITPISMIFIALFQSLAITLLFVINDLSTKKNKELKGATASSLGLGLLGAGCVACGGSLLTPILGVVAANVSVTLAERIGDILLIIAVVLSYYSLSKIAFKAASLGANQK